jgi:hypothetical protein
LQVVAIDKYRPQTCCVIGNYYSLKSMHEKAIIHFQRALRLDPGYISAWTLMGHEYVELRNTAAAIQAAIVFFGSSFARLHTGLPPRSGPGTAGFIRCVYVYMHVSKIMYA